MKFRKRRHTMEIERKFLVAQLPDNLDNYNCRYIEQGYLSTKPVVRVRRDNDDYYLTYKGSGMIAREEYNLPLTKDSYEHLIKKAAVLTNNMIANKIYLEAVPEDVNYEVVIYGNTASNSLSSFNELDEDSLDSLYKEYVASHNRLSLSHTYLHMTCRNILPH